ncbi:hypothetical protein XCR_0473 [Xanthomonas campestris pv. raphani 756C]|nr:hypothetical protein XCR_0473 [Xanthomonas campestris pv. raphani 756C]
MCRWHAAGWANISASLSAAHHLRRLPGDTGLIFSAQR